MAARWLDLGPVSYKAWRNPTTGERGREWTVPGGIIVWLAIAAMVVTGLGWAIPAIAAPGDSRAETATTRPDDQGDTRGQGQGPGTDQGQGPGQGRGNDPDGNGTPDTPDTPDSTTVPPGGTTTAPSPSPPSSGGGPTTTSPPTAPPTSLWPPQPLPTTSTVPCSC